MSRRTPAGSIAAGTIVGRYIVDALLGAGGMGEVYAARDTQLGRSVALKILTPDRATDPSRVVRFQREAELASSLNHPAIVTVFDAGAATLDDNTVVHFLAMELIDGETLSSWTRTRRDPQKIAEVLAVVADGLARAHASGIVHRDLKPQNIMVGRGGHPKILDFGVAKLVEPQPGVADPTDTAPAQGIGTGAYMSPEQIEGLPVDHRADIFSFGAVMYEALTGRAPFARGSVVESMHAVLHDEPEEPAISPELARIIRKCLVKDREERYQSIKDVALDLREAARHQPAEARSRRRLPAAIAAIAMVVTILLLAALTRDRESPTALAAPVSTPQPVMLRLTSNGATYSGAVSPDGNYVVNTTQDGENQTLWVRQIATGTNVRVIPPAPVYYFDVTVSSDGNYIFYSCAKRSEPNITDLWQIPLLGGEPRLIAHDMEAIFTVSPDAQKVAFVRFNAFERLYRMTMADVQTGTETVLIARPYPNLLGSMSWAPDGRTITFVGAVVDNKTKPLRPGLFNVDVATRRITPFSAPEWPGIGDIQWLPDGSGLIATVSDKQQPRQIWLLPRNGANARKITSDISMYSSLSVTSDSRSIVARRSDVTANLWVVDTQQPAKPRVLTTGLGNCFGAGGVRWMPDGTILYTICGNGQRVTSGKEIPPVTLGVIRPANGDMRELKRGFNSWQPAVSPDGKHIAVVSNQSGREEIWVMDIDGNAPRQVTHQGPVGYPSWTPDGQSLYFMKSGTEQALWRTTLDGSAERIIAHPIASPNLSRDGKAVLCRMRSTDPKTPLWRTAVIELADKDQPRFVPVPRSGGPPQAQWIDGHAFAYVDYVGGIANVWVRSVDDRDSRQVTNFDSGDILSYDYSADGRRVVVSHGERVDDMVLIRDFR